MQPHQQRDLSIAVLAGGVQIVRRETIPCGLGIQLRSQQPHQLMMQRLFDVAEQLECGVRPNDLPLKPAFKGSMASSRWRWKSSK